jgi:hypothetical protein
MEDFHITKEAFGPPKRTSSSLQHYINPYGKKKHKERERDISFEDPHHLNASWTRHYTSLCSSESLLIYFLLSVHENHRAPTLSLLPLRMPKAGKNHLLNEEITPLLPTGIGE